MHSGLSRNICLRAWCTSHSLQTDTDFKGFSWGPTGTFGQWWAFTMHKSVVKYTQKCQVPLITPVWSRQLFKCFKKLRSHPKAAPLLSPSPSANKPVLWATGLSSWRSRSLYSFSYTSEWTWCLFAFLRTRLIELISWSPCVEPKGPLEM